MSASDAAPLPRLGEVFFDVRGHSRSMRLSWYADTGVAVFSIWQGGTCTGTFRLPITDLSRMIDILQRGPQDRHDGDAGASAGADYAEPGYAGDYGDEYGADYDRDPGYRQGYSREQYGDAERPDYGSGTRGRTDYGTGDYGSADHRSGHYGAGDYRPGDFGSDAYGSDAYGSGDYDASDRQADHGYGPGQYRPGYVTGQQSVETDEAGYGQQRFVPPYVRAQRDSSDPDYLADPDYRPPADPGAGARHSPGRHSSGPEH